MIPAHTFLTLMFAPPLAVIGIGLFWVLWESDPLGYWAIVFGSITAIIMVTSLIVSTIKDNRSMQENAEK